MFHYSWAWALGHNLAVAGALQESREIGYNECARGD